MYKIALTGSVHSGKKFVSKKFEVMDVPVFYADTILKFALNHRLDIHNTMRKNFSEVFVGKHIDETKITDSKFDRIIDLIEYDVFAAFDDFCQVHKNSPYVLYKSSFIFERAIESSFDAIICVYAPIEDRIYRFQRNRPEYSPEYIEKMMLREIGCEEKSYKSNYVINNYDNCDLNKQISEIHNSLCKGIINLHTFGQLTKHL